MGATPDKRCTFLHVDDQGDDQYLVREVARLTGLPFRIEPFFSGEAALQYVAGAEPFDDEGAYPLPDFVLLDYDLGSMTADRVVARMRKQPRGKGLPIIVYTNSSDRGDMMRCYRAGANHFLMKPTSLERVKAILHTLYHCATARPPCYDVVASLKEHSSMSGGPSIGDVDKRRWA